MKRFTLDVAGVPVKVTYSKNPLGGGEMVVKYVQKDDNRTHFYVQSNPNGHPDALARWVHEEILRSYEKISTEAIYYIVMEK